MSRGPADERCGWFRSRGRVRGRLGAHLFGFERGDEPAGEQNVDFGRRGARGVAPRSLRERAALGREAGFVASALRYTRTPFEFVEERAQLDLRAPRAERAVHEAEVAGLAA